MVDECFITEFMERFAGESLDQRSVFTPEVVSQIGQEFEIPVDLREEIGKLLELGAFRWAQETRRADLDFKQIRKELTNLAKAASTLVATVENLSTETQELLVEAGFARELSGYPLPRVSKQESSLVLEYASLSNGSRGQTTLTNVQMISAALDACANNAQLLAGAGRKGRPDDEGLFDLLHIVFQIWESFLRRSFKLDWASDSEPITDAAKFSVRIARCVEPALTLQQIATAARKAREKSSKISNL